MEDHRSVLSAGAGEAEPGELPGVQEDEAVLGDVVVSVERMPVGEVHLCLGLRVPGPGLAGVLVAPPSHHPFCLLGMGTREVIREEKRWPTEAARGKV